MCDVARFISVGNEELDEPTVQLQPVVAEELLRLLVDQDDSAVTVDDQDGIGRRLKKAAELGV
jgi:hypothetical protein